MKFDITRVWKDEDYRQSLSPEEQAQMPVSPVGFTELSDGELDTIYGAHRHHSTHVTAINSLSAALCINSTGAAGFCITYGVGCGL